MSGLTYRSPRLVALALMVILAAGVSSLLSIGRQEDPTITNIFATITTPFPGADPARVEALVTAEIERELREIAELDTISSSSAAGMSIVNVELDETIDPARIDGIWSEIRDKLSDAELAFPAGALSPELETDSNAGAYGAIIALTLEDDVAAPLTLLARYGEALADQIRDVPGTKLVEVFGAPDEEITLTLNAPRAAAIGLSPVEVASAISASDAKVSAGQITGLGDDLTIEVAGEIDTLSRLAQIVLREGADGTTLRVADIATLIRGPAQPAAELAYQSGRPAILVAAMPESGLQVDVWAGFLRSDLQTYQSTLPLGMSAELVFDQSAYTAERLSGVGANMALGIALVIAVLLVTLGLRTALIVAAILPVVTLATLATMNAIGLPIHQMSVTGLIVALGLLVDAGIVMSDEIARRLREGAARLEAVTGAVRRLTMPLLASTATTALSFVPMILLPGPAGDFVGAIAIAVVVMLLWSFAVAVTITPAIAGWVLPGDASRSGGIPAGALGRGFRASLRWSALNPVRSIALSLVLPVLGFLSLPLLTAQFFPGVDRDQFHIEVDLPPGTGIARTQVIVERLDRALAGTEGIESVTWTVGRSAPAFYYNITGGRTGAPRYAQALIRTSSPEATEALLPDLQQSLPRLAPEAQVLVRGLVQGPPVSAPVELRLVGPELAVLRTEGDRLRRLLTRQDDITLARGSLIAGAPKLSIAIDEAAARQVGLTPGEVAAQMQAGLTGITGGSMIEGTEELPVRVRWGDARRADMEAMRDLPILPPGAAGLSRQGHHPAIPLSAIATLSLEGGDGVITRRNGERVNTIQGFLMRGVLPEEALAEVRSAMEAAGYALPPGYRLEIGGDSDARASTLNNLIAPLGLIVTLSIAVVVLTFGSFRLASVALIVSGLSAGLSMLALALFNFPFGILAIFGLIGSIGVSINAALIIMTALQEDDAASSGDADAIAEVVMRSSRHIVSTTITTVGGFLPLILAGGGFWPPFAVAIAGGVALSTVVSFYFTPPAFRLVYARFAKQAGAERAVPEGPQARRSRQPELVAAE